MGAQLLLSHHESEVYKQVLLELDSDATGDEKRLAEYAIDTESDAFSFEILRKRTEEQWESIRVGLVEMPGQRQQLREEQERLTQEVVCARAKQLELTEEWK